MIKEFVDCFMENKEELREMFSKEQPSCYEDVVRSVVKVLNKVKIKNYYSIDPERIHEIDDGDYQGTLVYIIGATGYQPDTYWSVKVWYGSCSGCDTLQAILACSSVEQRINDYMTLALHIVQGLSELNEEV